jgi:hypothetical protein
VGDVKIIPLTAVFTGVYRLRITGRKKRSLTYWFTRIYLIEN